MHFPIVKKYFSHRLIVSLRDSRSEREKKFFFETERARASRRLKLVHASPSPGLAPGERVCGKLVGSSSKLAQPCFSGTQAAGKPG